MIKRHNLIEGNQNLEKKVMLLGGGAFSVLKVRRLAEEETAMANWQLASETEIVTLRSRTSATRA